jgi:hypothetical protein
MRSRAVLVLFTSVVAVALLGACSSSTEKSINRSVDNAQKDVKKVADQATARVGAEAIRAKLLYDSRGDDSGPYTAIQVADAAKDLPGSPKVTGVGDANGDGRNDSRYLQVTAGKQAACVILPTTGTSVEVTGSKCPPTGVASAA